MTSYSLIALGLSALLIAAYAPASGNDDYAAERRALIAEIRADVRATASYLGRNKLDERVLHALETVARHRLIPESVRHHAYGNRPLPIGHGQTISQPYIVAIMTDLLDPDAGDRVLEIGTGSGYQAAVLAELVDQVFSIEIVRPLAERAKNDLDELGYNNIETITGDGYYGWPTEAPFDAIVVTAAASHVPPPLIAQLKPGGKMIIPVGSRFLTQQLVLIEKDAHGQITTRQLLPVRFVPLTGDH